MKTQKFDGTNVRIVLHGMICDSVVLSRISTKWEGGLFATPWANLVGTWCITHFKKYGLAPEGKIYDIFYHWAETPHQDEDKMSESIESFLDGIREEKLESEDSEYFLDVAENLFNEIRMQKELEESQLELEENQVDQWFSRLPNIRRFSFKAKSYSCPAEDMEAWQEAYDETRTQGVVKYAGALGDLTSGSFERGAFYAFMAPDKTGKTTWLTDLAYRAIRKRKRVAFFDTGDSILGEVYERFGRRVTFQTRHPAILNYPSGWSSSGEVLTEKRKFDGVNPVEGFRQFRKTCSSPDSFRISCYSNGTLSVADIDSILADWKKESWEPDVVVIDYADILASPTNIRDPLDQIDETWKAMRRLSQTRNYLVVTATQASAQIYGREEKLLGRQHFSGRKTKLAHVNGMLGINVTPKEKRAGVARVNWIVRRKGASNESECVTVAGSPAIYNPIILSRR